MGTMPSIERTRTAVIERQEDGLIQVNISPDLIQTLEDAQENIQTVERLCENGKGNPLLVNIQGAEPLAPEVRHLYSNLRMQGKHSALALVTDISPLGQMLGNIYLKVSKHGVPTRLYSDKTEAVQWLRICH